MRVFILIASLVLSVNQSEAQEAPLGDWLIYVGNSILNGIGKLSLKIV